MIRRRRDAPADSFALGWSAPQRTGGPSSRSVGSAGTDPALVAAIAAHAPVDVPRRSRWQCKRCRWRGPTARGQGRRTAADPAPGSHSGSIIHLMRLLFEGRALPAADGDRQPDPVAPAPGSVVHVPHVGCVARRRLPVACFHGPAAAAPAPQCARATLAVASTPSTRHARIRRNGTRRIWTIPTRTLPT
jgi:hypothetical protein